MNQKTIIWVVVAIVVLGVFVYLSSTQNISDVKNEENVGKTVSVKGTVQTVVKIGSLSGYTLEDETGTIAVSSEELPKEGETVKVRGTLIRDTLLGYYIKT